MAINQLQIPQSNINNTVDPSMWGTLGNLGNVYQKAQEQSRLQSTLAALGTDPQANMKILLGSGVPSLAQIGLNLQEKGVEQGREDKRYAITDRRADEQLAIQRAAAQRAQETYDKADSDEAAAAKLIAGFGQPPAAPVAPPVDPAFTNGAPPLAPSPAAQPSPAVQQSPIAPSPLDPSQLAATTSAAPPTIVDRVASNLTSPAPAAAAGISREQLADLYRNPITRPIATAFLQKQFSPGEWKYEKTEDGRIIATNSLDPRKTMDVTPPAPGGGAPASKQEREVQGYFQAGKNLGLNDDQARAFAANKGKTPSEDLHPDERKQIGTLTDMANTGQQVLNNIADLKGLSKSAWGFTGAGPASLAASTVLPDSLAKASGAVDTQDLINAAHSNVALVAKSVFGSRITNQDLKLLNELESSASQPDAVRQRLYVRTERMLTDKINAATSEADAIRNKTFYKPGGAAPAAQPMTPVASAPVTGAAPTGAKPSLADFMARARAANPGTSDGDLARYWKKEYGG